MFNGQELQKILKDWKYVWSTPGRIPGHEWVGYHNNTLFAYNGYVYVSVPFKCEGTFFFSAPQLYPTLGGEFNVDSEESQCKITSGKHSLEFNYPFTVSERIQAFKYLEHQWQTLVPDIEDLQFASETTTNSANDYRYAQVFVDKGFMYSTDGKSISKVSTKCVDTTFPNTVIKAVKEEIRGVSALDGAVAFKSGVYTFLYTYTQSFAKDIIKTIPIPSKAHKVILSDELKEIFTMSKRTNDEFKQKDLLVKLTFKQGNVKISVVGRKYKYESETIVDSTYEGSVEVSPDTVLGLATHFDEFYIEKGFLFAEKGGRQRYISTI